MKTQTTQKTYASKLAELLASIGFLVSIQFDGKLYRLTASPL